MKGKGKRPYKITKTKLKRILQSKYDKLKAQNPHLSESEVDKLFVEQQREYQRQKSKNLRGSNKKAHAAKLTVQVKNENCNNSQNPQNTVKRKKNISKPKKNIQQAPTGKAKKIYGRQLCDHCKRVHEEFWEYEMNGGIRKKYCRYCITHFKNQKKKLPDQYDEWRKPYNEVSGGGVNPR